MSVLTGSEIVNQPAEAPAEERRWRSLYVVGAIAAVIATVLFVSDFVVLTAGGPAPASALEWLTLLHDDRAAGLLQLFFTDLFGVGLIALVIFALYGALRQTNAAYSLLAVILAFTGVGIIFATNSNYSLLYLSDQYAAATGAVQQAQLLAATESALALGVQGTGLILASLLLEGALVIVCGIMLQGSIFGRWIAYLGLAAHGLDVARSLIFVIVVPFSSADSALAIGVPLLAIGGTLQLIWYPLVAWRLWRLGRLQPQAQSA